MRDARRPCSPVALLEGFNSPLEMQEEQRRSPSAGVGPVVSILHWRCSANPSAAFGRTWKCFNSPLEMLDILDSLATFAIMLGFNSPLEMQDFLYEPVAKSEMITCFNSPLEMPRGILGVVRHEICHAFQFSIGDAGCDDHSPRHVPYRCFNSPLEMLL